MMLNADEIAPINPGFEADTLGIYVSYEVVGGPVQTV